MAEQRDMEHILAGQEPAGAVVGHRLVDQPGRPADFAEFRIGPVRPQRPEFDGLAAAVTDDLAVGARLWDVNDAADGARQVDDGTASTWFLLDGIEGSAIAAVAQAGEVMPQKSTYFHPKAPAGLLFSPMEW